MHMMSVRGADQLGETGRAKLAFLLDHYSSTSPLRPLDVCDLNFGSCASLFGLVLTYIIVLMQFKSSATDVSKVPCSCPSNGTMNMNGTLMNDTLH